MRRARPGPVRSSSRSQADRGCPIWRQHNHHDRRAKRRPRPRGSAPPAVWSRGDTGNWNLACDSSGDQSLSALLEQSNNIEDPGVKTLVPVSGAQQTIGGRCLGGLVCEWDSQFAKVVECQLLLSPPVLGGLQLTVDRAALQHKCQPFRLAVLGTDNRNMLAHAGPLDLIARDANSTDVCSNLDQHVTLVHARTRHITIFCCLDS